MGMLDGSGLSRVTKESGMHAVQFSPNSGFYTDTYSNTMTPPRQDLYRADGSKAAVVDENDQSAQLAEFHLSPVEFFAIQSHDGVSLNCSMIKPPNFDPRKKYPVIVYTYGGPHAQVVINAWTGSTFLWHQMMAQKGYIIFALDNRGSAGRGHAFETPLYRRLGKTELADQLEGVQHLVSLGFVDPARIGIYGWSYGGFMTLYSLLNSPDTFRCGIAGAPVTSWHNYDTIYTERYLGLPTENAEGYQKSSAIEYAANLKAKLLMVHNIEDDNVLFQNSLQMAAKLEKEDKRFDMILYPQKSHGVSGPVRRNLLEQTTDFFENNLRPPSSPERQ